MFQLFSKVVKLVGDKSLQFVPPICYFFSNLESPLYLCVCTKWWYGIESISNSHSASSQLSGECMLLHSIHILANLVLREAVPPQPRTSPHCKKYILNTVNSGLFEFFRASAICSKILNVKRIFNTVKNFRGSSVFQGKRKSLKNPEQWKYFQ